MRIKRRCSHGHTYVSDVCDTCHPEEEPDEEEEPYEEPDTDIDDLSDMEFPADEELERRLVCQTCGGEFFIPVQRGRPPKWCNSCREAGAAVPAPKPVAERVPGWIVDPDAPEPEWVTRRRDFIRD